MDAATIAAVGAVLTAVTTPIGFVLVAMIQSRVHHELKTLNEGTVGSFAAENETRRIEAIPHDERTATEERHMASAPPPEPPVGPGR